ncbi:transposase [Vibrio splendidus]|uniref:transposase n=1 Tax=Vibrio splendidus TaxID=29497 RepID=UPI002159A835|nr:transposase [Vibrio splendidus]
MGGRLQTSGIRSLARYLYRGVLPDEDIISITDDTVTFRYKKSQTNAWRTRTLPTLKFLLLILQHALPKGLQRVRDYGFLTWSSTRLKSPHSTAVIKLALYNAAANRTDKNQSNTSMPLLSASDGVC